MTTPLTRERLQELLSYDPVNGFVWRVSHSRRIRVNTKAGTVNKYGKRIIKVDGRGYRESDLITLYLTGVLILDKQRPRIEKKSP